jgi:hypothetical protein
MKVCIISYHGGKPTQADRNKERVLISQKKNISVRFVTHNWIPYSVLEDTNRFLKGDSTKQEFYFIIFL